MWAAIAPVTVAGEPAGGVQDDQEPAAAAEGRAVSFAGSIRLAEIGVASRVPSSSSPLMTSVPAAPAGSVTRTTPSNLSGSFAEISYRSCPVSVMPSPSA